MNDAGLLHELASSYGIADSFADQSGAIIEAPEHTIVALLRAMGCELAEHPHADQVRTALQKRRDALAARPLPPCVVSVEGREHGFLVHVHDGAPAHVRIVLEDGSERQVYQDENSNPPTEVDGILWGEASFHIPGDLPRGYHRLVLDSHDLHSECSLIITPARLSTTDRFLQNPGFGVMAQLYSVRSAESWGIGDFHDLGELAATLAEFGADYLLINPLHAAEPLPPVEDSPYLPSSRRFVNPLYLCVEDVEEYSLLDASVRAEIDANAAPLKDTNHSPEFIDRDPIYELKLDALRAIFDSATSNGTYRFKDDARASAFEEFCSAQGSGLKEFAEFCARREIEQLYADSRHAITPDAEHLTVFHMWLQFLCDEQQRSAQKRALDAGMAVGIMTDLAVGVHPGGADSEAMKKCLVPGASVGAPPDAYSQQGQDWSQPPWNPHALAESGYQPWRELLATVLRHSGGIRVDHILGLFRLFWMQRCSPPSTGTYVYYDHEAMLGILCLEAERAGALVVGEDLGTVEHWVQEVLENRGVLGTSVLWFESDPHNTSERLPRRPEDFRRLAITSIATHDLPPIRGYLNGAHVKLRAELGVLENDAEREDADDVRWQNQVLDAARHEGVFAGTALDDATFEGATRDERGPMEDIIVGLHRYIAATPSALTCVNLVDMVGDQRVQNQPGTNAEQHANWCSPLCDGSGRVVLLEQLPSHPLLAEVAKASQRPPQQR